MERADVIVVGAGIVGLATSLELLRLRPGLHVVVLEKEPEPALHQTGRNSGVAHSGIYYEPGSLKAKFCVEGIKRLRSFCDEYSLPWAPLGKVIVATADSEVDELRGLQHKAEQNGVPGTEWLDPAGLATHEPYAAGIAALRVPGTASVDFAAVARAMSGRVAASGGAVHTAAPVIGIGSEADRMIVDTTGGEWSAGVLVNAAGLQADRIAVMAGLNSEVRIVPFRGEYHRIRPGRSGLVTGLIYPVPDPRFPFLGTHFTRTVHDTVEVGPNAVPALAREGYSWGTVRPEELWHSWGHRGSVRLAGRHWWTGLGEIYRSVSMRGFVRRLQRLVPDVSEDDLEPAGSGVRAQAVDRRGRLIDDFVVERRGRALHVLNAPSPAATAAFPIGEHLAGRVCELAGI